MNLDKLQELLFIEYEKNGYLKSWTYRKRNPNNITQRKYDLAELGLILTEIAEAMEEIRKDVISDDKLSEECADILIRTINFMSRKGYNAELAICDKDKYNKLRGKLHGKEV